MAMLNRSVWVLLALLFAGCAHEREGQSFRPPAPGQGVHTAADAIAVVLADIQRHGGNARKVECSAEETKESWVVTVWFRPFRPGGHATYFVGHDGEILRVEPGA
jgi:hypothetical protein